MVTYLSVCLWFDRKFRLATLLNVDAFCSFFSLILFVEKFVFVSARVLCFFVGFNFQMVAH